MSVELSRAAWRLLLTGCRWRSSNLGALSSPQSGGGGWTVVVVMTAAGRCLYPLVVMLID